MFTLCMSRGHSTTIQDATHPQITLPHKQVKGGYLLRYRKGFFCKGWEEEWVVLYEDSTLAWYADKGLNRPRGWIRICDAPDLLAVGEFTKLAPKRPNIPRTCHFGQLLAIGTRAPKDVYWLMAATPAEAEAWMTAISNTLPPPPQLPQEDKHLSQPPQNKTLLHCHQANQLNNKPKKVCSCPPSTYKTKTAPVQQTFKDDHTVLSGVVISWGHGYGWGQAAITDAVCTQEAVASALFCNSVPDYTCDGLEQMDWNVFADFAF